MRKVTVYFQKSASDDEILMLVRELECNPITGGVTIENDESIQTNHVTDSAKVRLPDGSWFDPDMPF